MAQVGFIFLGFQGLKSCLSVNRHKMKDWRFSLFGFRLIEIQA